jgi:hypothetical protein
MSRNGRVEESSFPQALKKNLSPAYALIATLFLGLVLKENYSDTLNKMFVQSNWILVFKLWGVLAVLFWIPALAKKPAFTLLHSLPFFFLFAKDLLSDAHSESGNDIIRNSMKIYTISFMFSVISLILMVLLNYLRVKLKENKTDNPGM